MALTREQALRELKERVCNTNVSKRLDITREVSLPPGFIFWDPAPTSEKEKNMLNLYKALTGSGASPRFHGNGFIQLPIGPNLRLHIWHNDWGPWADHNATIHDHNYDMSSRVLVGELEHHTYKTAANKGRYDAYKVQDKKLVQTDAGVNLRDNGTYRLMAGSRYTYPVSEIHQVRHIGESMAATIMQRSDRNLVAPSPRVFCTSGEQPMDAHDVQKHAHETPSDDEMWGIVDELFSYHPSVQQTILEAMAVELNG